jgi:uncharacterized repeat protein (TIGR01451 family)
MSFSQVIFAGSPTDTLISFPQCNHVIGVSVMVGANEDVVTISINWGDGTSTDSTFVANPGYTMSVFQHSFSSPSAYDANYTVYSQLLDSNIVDNAALIFIAASQGNCGYFGVSTFLQATNFLYADVPMDVTDNNGVTTTIFPVDVPWIGQVYFGLNLNNTPYSLNINPQWLSNNGLIQLSDTTTIISFYSSGNAEMNTGLIPVACTSQGQTDVAIEGGIWNLVAPLEYGIATLNLCNYGCSNIADVEVFVEFPSGLIPNLSSLPNANFNNDTLSFFVSNLIGCQDFYFSFSFPGNTPPSTLICLPLSITANDDVYLLNNFNTACGLTLNSYDPNDKQVNQPTVINPDTQETFNYQIRFQNDGNFPAVNVVVRDTISENLDLSTFRLLQTSHPVAFQVNPLTREVTFTFNAIWLESSDVDLEASQGFIRYEIQEKTGLVEGDAIENTAYIFFDFNPPIVTNTTINTNAYPLSVIQNANSSLTMYPNPSSGQINFSGDQVQKVVMYDVLGQVVLSKFITNNSLSVNNLNRGLYFVEVHTNDGMQTKRLVLK